MRDMRLTVMLSPASTLIPPVYGYLKRSHTSTQTGNTQTALTYMIRAGSSLASKRRWPTPDLFPTPSRSREWSWHGEVSGADLTFIKHVGILRKNHPSGDGL